MIFPGCAIIMGAVHGTTALPRERGHTTIYRRRELALAGSIDALSGNRTDPDAQAQQRIRELERALGRKTMELEILG